MNAQGSGLNRAIRRYDVIYQLCGAQALGGFFRPVDLIFFAASPASAVSRAHQATRLTIFLMYCVLRISSTHLYWLKFVTLCALSPNPEMMLSFSGPTKSYRSPWDGTLAMPVDHDWCLSPRWVGIAGQPVRTRRRLA